MLTSVGNFGFTARLLVVVVVVGGGGGVNFLFATGAWVGRFRFVTGTAEI